VIDEQMMMGKQKYWCTKEQKKEIRNNMGMR
jgi:hypothetical protein